MQGRNMRSCRVSCGRKTEEVPGSPLLRKPEVCLSRNLFVWDTSTLFTRVLTLDQLDQDNFSTVHFTKSQLDVILKCGVPGYPVEGKHGDFVKVETSVPGAGEST
jgi:hypothetical protein